MIGRKTWLIVGLVLVLGLAAWLLLGSGGDSTPPITGKAVAVKQGEIKRLVVSTGTVKPQVGALVKVGARVSGRVDRLLVSIGQKVQAGQVVAEIEHNDLEAKLAQAKAEVEAARYRVSRAGDVGPHEVEKAKAELEEVKVQLRLARVELKRNESLRAGDLVAQQSLDEALQNERVYATRLKAAEAKLAQAITAKKHDFLVAKADLEAAQARLNTAQVNLDYSTVRAPISGVVSSVSTQEGETVAASLNAPTFITIVDLTRLQVEDLVDEGDIGLIKVGQAAFFMVDAFPKRRFRGEVEAVHPSAELVDDVVYYPVIIKITDKYQGLLKPEMTATVSVVVGEKNDALWVPAAAVRRSQGKSVVYLDTPEGPERTQVVTGWLEDSRQEIVKGLKAGQKVIVPERSLAGRPGPG